MANADFEGWLSTILHLSCEDIQRLLNNSVALHFLITWSLFETRFFDQRIKFEKIPNTAESCINGGFDILTVHKYALHFHERYQDKCKAYQNLLYDKTAGKNKQRCDQFPKFDEILSINIQQLNSNETLEFLIYIIYRFRNNIVHGNKGVSSWLKFDTEIGYCTVVMQLLISNAERVKPKLNALLQ